MGSGGAVRARRARDAQALGAAIEGRAVRDPPATAREDASEVWRYAGKDGKATIVGFAGPNVAWVRDDTSTLAAAQGAGPARHRRRQRAARRDRQCRARRTASSCFRAATASTCSRRSGRPTARKRYRGGRRCASPGGRGQALLLRAERGDPRCAISRPRRRSTRRCARCPSASSGRVRRSVERAFDVVASVGAVRAKGFRARTAPLGGQRATLCRCRERGGPISGRVGLRLHFLDGGVVGGDRAVGVRNGGVRVFTAASALACRVADVLLHALLPRLNFLVPAAHLLAGREPSRMRVGLRALRGAGGELRRRGLRRPSARSDGRCGSEAAAAASRT